ncbi:hypothetical protein JCM6882_006182 [Rhodosporidiobolus microsporus]
MPLDIRPLPALLQDPFTIPPFLSGDTFTVRFLPFTRLRFWYPHLCPPSTDPYAAWDMELETHWRKFHPRAWEILEGEDQGDWAEFDRLSEEHIRGEREGVMTAEEDDAIRLLMKLLLERIVMRDCRLAGKGAKRLQ